MVLSFNPYAVPLLLAAALNFALSIWVFRQAPHGRLRAAFLWWNSWLGLWNLGLGVGYLMTDLATAATWYKIYSPLVIRFLTPFFLNFVVVLTGFQSRPSVRRALWAAYGVAAAFAVVDAGTSLLTAGAQRFYWGFYPKAGPWDAFYGPYFITVVVYAFVLLFQAIRQSRGHRRNQLAYVMAGALVAFLTGFTNFLPVFGVAIYPIGNVMNSLYSLLVAYAILEYGLMDIHLALRQSLVYGSFTGALTIVYLSIVSVFNHLFSHYGVSEKFVYYTAAMPATIALAPALKARIEPWIDHVPFWNTYRYSDILRRFGQSVLSVLDLQTVATRVVHEMTSVLSTNHGAVYVTSAASDALMTIAVVGPPPSKIMLIDHPVVRYIREHHEELIKEKEMWVSASDEGSPLLNELASWPYALAIPLSIDRRFIGFVALGEKVSGNMFNSNDIRLIRAMAGPAAVAISNALTVRAEADRRRQSDRFLEWGAAGALAVEIAHELAKPLTHILHEKSRLQPLVSDDVQKHLDKIASEASRVSDILKGFAMLAPDRPLERAPTIVPDLCEEALSNVGILEDSSIVVERQYDFFSEVSINAEQILQVLSNIIQNAWQAMPDGGILRVNVHALAGALSGTEIVITDTGPGISKEIQEKVFDRFFTTKQAHGGSGLGLAICRAMVERHGGDIQINSPITAQRGTGIIIRLPDKREG